jgi:mono/diheme cytochrome c family protein
MSLQLYRCYKLFFVFVFLLSTVSQMSGCGGEYSGEDDDDVPAELEDPTDPDPGSNAPELEAFFNANIEPQMSYCGVCHTPGGVADTDEGNGFLLSSNQSHYLSFEQAWIDLGGGVESNLLLVENADLSEPHTGGKTWPASSQIYADVVTLLSCWEEPASCPLVSSGTTTPSTGSTNVSSLPLLGSTHGNHVWNQFCESESDDALLPPDPRTLIQAGVNQDKAVYFNAFYEDCHVNLPEEEQAPKTCGEYKNRVAKGDYFANKRAAMTDLSISSSNLSSLWKQWGLDERPDNFDQLLTERYGFNPAPYPNPYPLPGEDPINTNGGSGQLPMGLIQGRDDAGNYNGKISMNCYICHGGQIGFENEGEGLGSIPGMGNTNTDMMIFMRDISRGLVGGLLPIALNNTRGTSNAVGAFDMLTLVWDVDTLSLAPNPLKLPFTHSYHGNQDMPNWWNTSHRPRKFFDGGVSVDATRIDMAAADQVNLLQSGASRRAATELHDQDLQAYVDAQVAPKFPGEIDQSLAEQGAIVFHNKNLWSDERNAGIPQPQGNGSCAGCHGVYSPRYAHDEAFLDDPSLVGVASYLVPLEIIQTDPARALSISPKVREVFRSTWWGYPDGVDGYLAPGEKGVLQEYIDDFAYPIINPDGRPTQGACGWIEDFGYLAPPLYGVWASSPYFHNGSVPTLRQVLKPEERPTIWRRYDSPVAGNVKGYDMSLQAYDLTDQVGWKYDEYCSRQDSSVAECSGDNRVVNNLLYQWLDSMKDDIWILGFLSKPYGTQKQIDRRKIFNTHDFSNSNSGHEFTQVLSDVEVRALVEYMKTL